MNETTRCSKSIYDPRMGGFRKSRACKRPAVKNGLCAIHQPEASEKRTERSRERWEAESRRNSERRRLESAAPMLLALVRAIVEERGRCFVPTNDPTAPLLLDWDNRAQKVLASLEVAS